MSNITKFPISTWKRIKNSRGLRAVSCIVSERWIQFSEESAFIDFPYAKGEACTLFVMTNDKNDNPRKICELIITKEELLQALANVSISTAK